jgi:beta-glucanase (GH16 family)
VDALPAVSSSSTGVAQFTYSVPPLTAIDPTKSYSFYGAELTGRDQFKYGRFEARMKMAAISGTVSSMFVYYDDSWEKGEKPWNEIDIEVLGKAPDAWQSNIITREGDPSIKANTASESKPLHEFGFDATQDFHLYAIVWTPEYVSWEIDSVEVRRDTLGMSRGTHADADQVKFLTEEQSLRFNLWASKSAAWTGKWDGGIGLPIEQQIDYVRVYSYDEATKGFTVLWQDDFDGEDLDPKHWDRGNWEMERVNLRPDNVIVENGVCRLIMDYEAN